MERMLNNMINNLKKNSGSIEDVDLTKIINLYNEIKLLEENKNKENIYAIKRKLLEFRMAIEKLQEKVIDLEEKYYNITKNVLISDIPKIFKVIVRLANEKENKYKIKVFYATNLDLTSEKKYDLKKYSIIWVISDKKEIDKIDSNKIYYRGEFSNEIDYLLMGNNSVVSAVRNGYGVIIEPTINKSQLEKFDIMTDGVFSNIDCYLYNDELRKSVKLFKDFFENNDFDLSLIDEYTIFNMIKEFKKIKKM